MAILKHLAIKKKDYGDIQRYEDDRVCTAQLFRDALRNPYGKPSRQDSMEIGDIMRYSITGWRPCGIQRFEEFGRQRAWERVNKVCQQSDENPEGGRKQVTMP